MEVKGRVVFQMECTTGLAFLTAVQGNKAISLDPLVLVITVANPVDLFSLVISFQGFYTVENVEISCLCSLGSRKIHRCKFLVVSF